MALTCVAERRAVVPDVVLACRHTDTRGAALFLARSPRIVPHVARPVATTPRRCQREVSHSMYNQRTHQSVVSKMDECELKNLLGSQPDAGQNAMGLPHPSGIGEPEEMSEGMLLRGKNQTEMPLSTHCTENSQTLTSRSRTMVNKYALAYTPPPLLLNPTPYVLLWVAVIPHPAFPVSAAAQLVPPTTFPVMPSAALLDEGIVHPCAVWIVAWLFE